MTSHPARHSLHPLQPTSPEEPAQRASRRARSASSHVGAACLAVLLLAACGGAERPPAEAEGGAAGTAAVEDLDAYRAEIAGWQEGREEGLRRPGGWLTLVGLHWLEEGVNDLGADPMSDVVLPAQAPTRFGHVTLAEDGRMVLTLEPGVDATVGGEPITSVVLVPDVEGEPTTVELGSLRIYAIRRGAWSGLRVRDLESPALAAFEGIDTFPVDPKWRVEARLEPYDSPRMVDVPDVTGNAQPMASPGVLRFTLDGRELSLQVFDEGGEELFLIFSDATSGKETYGAGRYLYAPKPDAGGTLVVDFNRAQNPPCAFTPYATCPLPPPQNKLAVAVTAGEKKFGSGHH